MSQNSKLRLIDPVVYLEFLSLQKNATVVITNSGGIQDSTYVGYYDGLFPVFLVDKGAIMGPRPCFLGRYFHWHFRKSEHRTIANLPSYTRFVHDRLNSI